MVEHNNSELIAECQLDEHETQFYKNEGWLLLPNLLNSAKVGSVRSEILDVVTQLGTRHAELSEATEVKHKLLQSPQYLKNGSLDAMVNSPRLRALAAHLVGGACQLYMPFTAVKSGGGGGQFHFHQDNNYTRFENGLLGVNIWFALVDMTPENGALCIEPRTHLNGTLAAGNVGQGDGHQKIDYEPNYYLPVRMRAGDAIAFTRLTVHGSGPNVTPNPRVAYSVQFHRDDVIATWNDQEPQLLKGADRWPTAPVDRITAKAS